MKTWITGGTIVNQGRKYGGTIVIDGETIADILPATAATCLPETATTRVVDVSGCFVLPGMIDSHVHFREPGMTHKATIATESEAAAAGGVTTFFDMPNTIPQTTTLKALNEKLQTAARDSRVNYAFFIGATRDNAEELSRVSPQLVPGIKVFMGSSTGGMLVDGDDALERLFSIDTVLPFMAHCEDTSIIEANMERHQQRHGDDPDVAFHPEIRSREACIASARKAVALALKHHKRLHIAHLSTAEELSMMAADTGVCRSVTAEATVGHLWFSDADYARLGTRIKVNPSIKTASDRAALRQGIADGRITTVGTDHAPHLLTEKAGGCRRASSGMPMVQYALVAMLELVSQGVISIERLAELTAHNPARLFSVQQRGFVAPGMQADLAVVRPCTPWSPDGADIRSKCGWSPMEDAVFHWRVAQTWCNGHEVFDGTHVDSNYRGQQVRFR